MEETLVEGTGGVKGLIKLFDITRCIKNSKKNKEESSNDHAMMTNSPTGGGVDGTMTTDGSQSPKSRMSPSADKQPVVDLSFLCHEQSMRNNFLSTLDEEDSTLRGLAYDMPSLGTVSTDSNSHQMPLNDQQPRSNNSIATKSLGSVSESTDPNEVSMYDEHRYNSLGANPPRLSSAESAFLFRSATDLVLPKLSSNKSLSSDSIDDPHAVSMYDARRFSRAAHKNAAVRKGRKTKRFHQAERLCI